MVQYINALFWDMVIKFYRGVCKVSIQYVKGNLSYNPERNDG